MHHRSHEQDPGGGSASGGLPTVGLHPGGQGVCIHRGLPTGEVVQTPPPEQE